MSFSYTNNLCESGKIISFTSLKKRSSNKPNQGERPYNINHVTLNKQHTAFLGQQNTVKMALLGLVQRPTSLIPILEESEAGGSESQVSQGYIIRPCFKIKTNKNNKSHITENNIHNQNIEWRAIKVHHTHMKMSQ